MDKMVKILTPDVALAYLVNPIDLMPGCPIDDAIIVMLAIMKTTPRK